MEAEIYFLDTNKRVGFELTNGVVKVYIVVGYEFTYTVLSETEKRKIIDLLNASLK